MYPLYCLYVIDIYATCKAVLYVIWCAKYPNQAQFFGRETAQMTPTYNVELLSTYHSEGGRG